MVNLLMFLFGDNVVGRLMEEGAIMLCFRKDKRVARRILARVRSTTRRLIQLQDTRAVYSYRLFDDTGKPTSENTLTRDEYKATLDLIALFEKRGLASYVDGTRSRPTNPTQIYLFKIGN